MTDEVALCHEVPVARPWAVASEQAGNPYKIPHEKVMQTIERMGKRVLPKLA